MTTLDDAKKAQAALEAKLRKLRKLTRGAAGVAELSERERDAARKRESRAANRTVEIPAPEDLARRTALERDTPEWLRYYMPHAFTDPWTETQLTMIGALEHAMIYHGDQAIAAPRGEGKSIITVGTVLKNLLVGQIRFPVIFSATGDEAKQILGDLKTELEENDRLAADYPEVCAPIRALESSPSRSRTQLVSGDGFFRVPSRFGWSGREISLPRVPGSRAAGSIVATRGLDGAVRGLRRGSMRPDLAILDDPDTYNSAENPTQADKLEKKIERTIGLLSRQNTRIGRVMLTTIQTPISVSAKYTDPKQKPSWRGLRFKFLAAPPDRQDLWDEYVMLRMHDRQEGDADARKAHRFYLDRRVEMDAGAVVSNPASFATDVLPDGTPSEVSAVQHYFNLVADMGQDAVDCELQNDPPKEVGWDEVGLSAYRIQKQLSGYDRTVVPPGCVLATQGIDVGKRALHWIVIAWRADATGYVIDYGVEDVHGTVVGSDEGVDRAVMGAIASRIETVRETPYKTLDGEDLAVDLSLVDSRWQSKAVWAVCRQLSEGVRTPDIRPAMGHGKSLGCVQTTFAPPSKRTEFVQPGDGWYLKWRPEGVNVVHTDTDRWKGYVHARLLTATDRPGTMFLFGQPNDHPGRPTDDEKRHFTVAKHLTAEAEIEQMVRGVLVRRWKAKSNTNHYFDAAYMACVAAAMRGVCVMPTRKPPPKIRPSLTDLAGGGGR